MEQISIIKAAIGGETFSDYVDVLVHTSKRTYVYKNVFIHVYYNIPYEQMNIDICWKDETANPSYEKLGLHCGYNTKFQLFSLIDRSLIWKDGENQIQIDFVHK